MAPAAVRYVVLVLAVAYCTGNERDCPSGCKCNHTRRVVTCKDARLRTIPESPRRDVRRMIFRGNHVDTLTRRMLSGYPRLQYLSLDWNEIRDIEEGAFLQQKNLQVLHLSGNRIGRVDRAMFLGLENLTRLDLNANGITTIPSGSLQGLGKLQILTLVGNDVNSLPGSLFRELPNIRRIALSGRKLSSLPNKAWRNVVSLRTLHLVDFPMERLVGKAFTDLPKLTGLFLERWEQLSIIADDSFVDLNLTSLSLAGGSLTQVPVCAINHLIWLTKLQLSGNPIATIPRQAFANLTMVQALRLDHMHLTEISSGAFAHLSNLRLLDLSYNYLVSLPARSFRTPISIHHLVLAGNNWHCNCELQWIFEKGAEASIHQASKLVCRTPPHLHGVNMVEQQGYNLTCQEPLALITQGHNMSVPEGTELQLQCVTAGDPLPKVTWWIPGTTNFTADVQVEKTNVKGNVKGQMYPVLENRTLSIPNVTHNNSGVYTCFVENDLGSAVAEISVLPQGYVGSDDTYVTDSGPVEEDVLQVFDEESTGKSANGSQMGQIDTGAPPQSSVNPIIVASLLGSATFLGVVVFCMIFLLIMSWIRPSHPDREDAAAHTPRRQPSADREQNHQQRRDSSITSSMPSKMQTRMELYQHAEILRG
ncbi:PREDICTED: leucine-rich repeat and immunoglobulin-like domain-containing nogo receptor-interacting protein 2 [Branchiostoma belcheri]|uniref:Leucine-rich repeat and immunoglobulin-like domain-containing nogo receptor-interacting protein 2 n=1 Tax=Branchiostoma belcheri TaxID=7741 RepID=A0A6P5AHE6_BRABE|nr:PREDICTED: leucine-rich repeat and immunoglobulin-like domain-containing nogo receptor-interacting protein 2 [Branchiostoma belcheri]